MANAVEGDKCPHGAAKFAVQSYYMSENGFVIALLLCVVVQAADGLQTCGI
jgi:hypothetical protein